MFSEVALGLWSATGIAWWLIAWWLVAQGAKGGASSAKTDVTEESLSIFKPLPQLGQEGLTHFRPGLESFIRQMGTSSELLLGVHEPDRTEVALFIEEMRAKYPEARLKVVHRREADAVANPKIAWQRILAHEAEGELWLWSDADIVAPDHFLKSLRDDYGEQKTGMLTCPYVVREITTPPALWDALYVNTELYPGVLLLKQRGAVDFGLGAGMLFRRAEFAERVDWEKLGAALADDFYLGQALSPVRVSGMTLVTVAEVETWKAAVGHTFRWSKTVRWNRPGGTAARVIVLPLLGWMIEAIFRPGGWIGLVLMMQLEVFFAATICRRAGCRWTVQNLLGTELWTLGRVLIWLACWLPWPVVWRGRRWWRAMEPTRNEKARLT